MKKQVFGGFSAIAVGGAMQVMALSEAFSAAGGLAVIAGTALCAGALISGLLDFMLSRK